MADSTSTHEIVHIYFNLSKPSLSFESSWLSIILIFSIGVSLFVIGNCFRRWNSWYNLEIEISGSPRAIFKVERNYENLYIANRIYIELTTRKAAILIDEDNDSIEEIYNSWYHLFGIIRDELKSLPGKYLKNHNPTVALVGISQKILNDALRPHLTEYQARFRHWLDMSKKEPVNQNLTPQELQKKYPDFTNLIASMKNVNKTLIDYASELDKLIKGKS